MISSSKAMMAPVTPSRSALHRRLFRAASEADKWPTLIMPALQRRAALWVAGGTCRLRGKHTHHEHHGGGPQKLFALYTIKIQKNMPRGEYMTDKQAIDTHSDGLRRGEPREAGVNAAIVAAFLDNAAAAGL